MRRCLLALAVAVLLPSFALAETSVREELEDVRAELARVERLLSERSTENWGRAQERLSIVRDKLAKFAERLEKLEREGALEVEPKKADAKPKTAEKLPMDAAAFEQLRIRLTDARKNSLREAQLKTQLATAYLSVEQALTLLRVYNRTEERLEALAVMAPRLTDRQNALVLQDAFDRAGEKEKALLIINKK